MNKPFNMKGWRTMDSAPKDGSEIIVLETPNGEHFNVLLACWMALSPQHLEHKNWGIDNTDRGRWWGVTPSHRSSSGPLHTHWLPLACSPICWKPMVKHSFSIKQLKQLLNTLGVA
jgi:hypothetical protein